MLLSAQKQSHVLVKSNCITDDNTDVENLVTASNLVKSLGKEPLWESKCVDHCSSDVEGSTLEPRSCISTCVDISFVSIQILEN